MEEHFKPHEWPFDQPQNCAVITVKSIVRGGKPILYVALDDEDDDWQFLDGGDAQEENAMVVSLSSMVERDPSLRELADLPPGWSAKRKAPSDPWQRFPPRRR